jgi:hypothetical protein
MRPPLLSPNKTNARQAAALVRYNLGKFALIAALQRALALMQRMSRNPQLIATPAALRPAFRLSTER